MIYSIESWLRHWLALVIDCIACLCNQSSSQLSKFWYLFWSNVVALLPLREDSTCFFAVSPDHHSFDLIVGLFFFQICFFFWISSFQQRPLSWCFDRPAFLSVLSIRHQLRSVFIARVTRLVLENVRLRHQTMAHIFNWKFSKFLTWANYTHISIQNMTFYSIYLTIVLFFPLPAFQHLLSLSFLLHSNLGLNYYPPP